MDEKRVIKTVKKVMPAVVSIVISKRLEDLEREMPTGHYPFIPGHPNMKHERDEELKMLGAMADENKMVEVGGGSGCLVDPDGLVLTNKHVIDDSGAEYTVILNDGRRFSAKVLSRDPINDIAILKIDATDLPFLKLGDARNLELGESVIAIGNALGMFKNTVSLGIVSGLSRAITAQTDPGRPQQEMRGLIQTDAAINPGNSGGPLVDGDGRVIGVNAAIISGAQSIGFAIPVNTAERDLADLKKYGRIRRPLLGLRYLMIDASLQKKMNLPVAYGALIVRESENDAAVVPESPAAKADIREKDIVLSLNSKKLDADHPIQDFLDNMNVGDVLDLAVLRDGKEFSAKVTLAERK
ncbi:MAG: trypsin-like peptidase domain-containing protein [Minisyncoccia bacterium]|jgi:S1-C subfamily serine protease